jgi:hypothetical protein
MIVYAFNKISAEPSVMNEDVLCVMRQLINGYRHELSAKGIDPENMRTELEDLAIAAGLSALGERWLRIEGTALKFSGSKSSQ